MSKTKYFDVFYATSGKGLLLLNEFTTFERARQFVEGFKHFVIAGELSIGEFSESYLEREKKKEVKNG